MKNKILASNILLAEYYAECKFEPIEGSNFIRKQYTNGNKTENEIELYNRFPIGNDYIKYMCNKELGKNASLKFHQKWDWLIPVFSKVSREIINNYETMFINNYEIMCNRNLYMHKFYDALRNSDLKSAYNVVVFLVKQVKNE